MSKSIDKIKKIYLDHASSALSLSANPGAIHVLGVKEKSKLENSRKNISKILDCHSDEIIFTSGATESNNLAILGLIHPTLRPPIGKGRVGERSQLPHIVTTNIEHASVLEVCKHLEKTKQIQVTYVEVEERGIVDPRKIKKALRPNTVLVSVMYANNEIGTIQPIQEIAKEIRHYRKNLTRLRHPLLGKERVGERCIFPFFHTDATQAVNYLPINVKKLGVDLMSFNAAKIYGPKGVGVLYVKRNTPIKKIMFGGDQEGGLRPGTENVAGAVALAYALEITQKMKDKEARRLEKLKDYFLNKLVHSNVGADFGIRINGDLKNRLPNNVNITIPNMPSDLLVIELSARGIMASAKSACKSGDGKDSHVILALQKKDGLPVKALASAGSLRFSLGRGTNKKDIDYTIKSLAEILQKLKKWY